MISLTIFSEAITYGGGERALSLIISYLDKKKFDITLLCSSNLIKSKLFAKANLNIEKIIPIDDLLSNLTEVNKTMLKEFRYRGIFLSLRRAQIYRDFLKNLPQQDILHIANALNYDAITGAKLAKAKRIVGTYRLLPKGVYTNPSQVPLINKMIVHFLDHITIPSNIGKELWSKALGIPLSKVTVINNGIVLENKNNDYGSIQSIKESLGLDVRKTTLLCVGNLLPNKGHSVLLKALSEMLGRKSKYSFQVLFVGGGPLQETLNSEIESSGLSEYVKILGFKDDVFPYYVISDIVILPTLYEHFPWSVLEAMGMGKPVIASNIGGIPEIIDNEDNGLLVSPNDSYALSSAIERLLSEPKLRNSLGFAARQKVELKFSVQQMVRETESVYDNFYHESY